MSWKFKLTAEEYTSLIESFSQLEMFEKYTPNYEKHTYHTPRIVQDSHRPKSELRDAKLRTKNGTVDPRRNSAAVSSLSDDDFCRLYLQPASRCSRKLKLRGTKPNIELEPWRESQFNRAFRKEYKRRKEKEEAKEKEKSLNRSWSWETSKTDVDFAKVKEINSTWIYMNGSNGVDGVLPRSEHSAFTPASNTPHPGKRQRPRPSSENDGSFLRQNGLADSGGSTGGGELPADSTFMHVGTPLTPLNIHDILADKRNGSVIEKENGQRSSSQQNLRLNGHDNLQKSSGAPSSMTSSFNDFTNKSDDNVSPSRARQKSSQEARKMSADDRPIRSSYADNRLIRGQYDDDQPIRRQSADDRPIRRQSADDQPIKGQQEDNRPVKSVPSNNSKQNSLEESSNSKLDSPSRKSANADDRPIRPAYTSEKPKRSRSEHKSRENSHSKSSLKSHNEKSQRSQGESSVCSRCQRTTEHPHKSTSQDSVSEGRPVVPPLSTVSLCSGLLQLVAKRAKAPKPTENFVEKILSNCECLKVCIINIQEAYTTTQEAGGDTKAVFCGSPLAASSSVTLVCGLELLLSHVHLWSVSLCADAEAPIHTLIDSVQTITSQLAADTALFLKSCEHDEDTAAQDAASRCIDAIFQLARLCGEIAITTETVTTALTDPEPDSLADLISLTTQRDEDILDMKASVDLKQSFLGGVDGVLGHSLDNVLSTVDDAEAHMQRLVDSCHTHMQENSDTSKHCYIVTVTLKALLLQCKAIQEQLDGSMADDGVGKPRHYFHVFYERCERMLAQLGLLANNVALLSQAAGKLQTEKDVGTLRKVCRCTEMVGKAVAKLALVCGNDTSIQQSPLRNNQSLSSLNGLSLETHSSVSKSAHPHHAHGRSRSSHPVVKVLSERQEEQLRQASGDVTFATHALATHVKARVLQEGGGGDSNLQDGTGAKVKRMLPIPPGAGIGGIGAGKRASLAGAGALGGAASGRKILRCQSAKARISRNMSLGDLSTSSDL